MNKRTIWMVLLLAGLAGKACAQYKQSGWYLPNKADATFNMVENAIHHRHKVWLDQGNTMMVELFSLDEYKKLTDLEALLNKAQEDLSFVADSIRQYPSSNYRIDYQWVGTGGANYRMQRYEPKGTFLYRKGERDWAPFKSEWDTLKFTFVDAGTRFKKCQVTFVLNRFANMEDILAEKGRLNRIIDTFFKAAQPRYAADKKWPSTYYSTIYMFKMPKDTSKYRVDYRPYLVEMTQGISLTEARRTTVTPIINFGAGFVRDRLSPVGELGIMYRLPGTRTKPTTSILGLYASGYFAFERNSEGRFTVQDNWFVNAEIGDEGENEFFNALTTSRLTAGVGYLVSQKGDYFTNTTMKLFMNIRLKNGITLTPEIITTDNFKQAFPGLTIKIF